MKRKVSAVESAADLTRFITRLIGCPDLELDAELPLGKQTEVSSLQLIELAIALEQECGIELPDDIDLRETTPAELAAADAQVPTRGPADD
jgi:acyl carrier protein